MNKITIRDVARVADVSISTVSKALNNVDVVKPETKKKILEVANELHYVPNLMGKQLKKRETGMIGFYTNSVKGPYFSILFESIAKEAEKFGYGLNIFISSNKKVVLNSIMGNLVDGIIGFEDLINNQDLLAIKREKIKMVFIDRNISDKTIGSVTFDSYCKGKEVTEYLIDLGHKSIGFIRGYDTYDSYERLRGYKEALNNSNIPYNNQIVLEGNLEESIAYTAVRSLLSDEKRAIPSAIIAVNDLSAIGAVKAIESLGYHVPKDISVIGFDDVDLLEYFTPKLTTVQNPIEKQGKLAVKHLIDMIENKAEGCAFELQGTLIVRDSTSKSSTRS